MTKNVNTILAKKMKTSLPFLILLLLFVSCVAARAATDEELLKYGFWMMRYHIDPKPEEVIEVIVEMDRIRLFKPANSQYPFLGFASRLFQDNPNKITGWFDKLAGSGLDGSSQNILYLALWLSATKEGESVLEKHQYRLPERNYFGFDVSKPAIQIEDMDRLRPGYLDMNWGQFFVSGDKQPVLRILSFFEFFAPVNNVDNTDNVDDTDNDSALKAELVHAALWSVQSNCETIPGFKELLGEIYINKELNNPALSFLGLLLTRVHPEKFYSN